MYGWIDESRGQWKNATGRIEPLTGSDPSGWNCPVCEEFGEDNALMRQGDPAHFVCSKGHGYDLATITDDSLISPPPDPATEKERLERAVSEVNSGEFDMQG